MSADPCNALATAPECARCRLNDGDNTTFPDAVAHYSTNCLLIEGANVLEGAHETAMSLSDRDRNGNHTPRRFTGSLI
jgi:hypothetical protein